MKKLTFALLLLSTTNTFAQTAYKCVVNNVTVYQFQPCDNATEKEKINIKEETEEEKLRRESLKPPIEIGDLEIKKGSIKYDSLYYYAKVSVKNNSDKDYNGIVTFLGMDSRDFAITRIYLYGKAPPNSTVDFTATEQFLDVAKFNKIREWKLEGKK